MRAPAPANTPRRIWLALGGLGLALVAAQLWWLAANDRPPMWDSALHLTHALRFLDFFRHGGGGLTALLGLSPFYPPLFYILLAPLLALRAGPDTATLIHLPFLAALLGSVFYLGRRATGRAEAGLLAAGLTAAWPHVVWLSRDVVIDFETVALTALIVALAAAAEGFSRRRLTVGLGIVFGLGLLTKWTVLFYTAGPLALLAVQAWRRAPDAAARRAAADNVAWAAVAAAAVAWPWYLHRAGFLAAQFLPVTQGLGPVEGDPAVWSLAGWSYYLRALCGWHLFGPLFLVFLAAVAAALIRLARRRTDAVAAGSLALALVWVAVPYVVFTLLANKAPRHISPVLPAVSLLITGFVFGLKQAWLRRTLAGACAGVAAAQFLLLTFGCPLIPPRLQVAPAAADAFAERFLRDTPAGVPAESIRHWPDAWFVYQQDAFGIWTPPRREDWRLAAIVRHIGEHPAPGRASLGLVPDAPRFNVWSFRATAALMKQELAVWRISAFDPDGAAFRPYRWVLLADGNQGPVWNTADNARLTAFVRQHPERFVLRRRWPLPGGATARLYEHRQAEVPDDPGWPPFWPSKY